MSYLHIIRIEIRIHLLSKGAAATSSKENAAVLANFLAKQMEYIFIVHIPLKVAFFRLEVLIPILLLSKVLGILRLEKPTHIRINLLKNAFPLVDCPAIFCQLQYYLAYRACPVLVQVAVLVHVKSDNSFLSIGHSSRSKSMSVERTRRYYFVAD